MLAHQGDVVQVMVFDDGLIAPGDVFRGGQQSEVAMVQNVLFVRRKRRGVCFCSCRERKKVAKGCPDKSANFFTAKMPTDEEPRPSRP